MANHEQNSSIPSPPAPTQQQFQNTSIDSPSLSEDQIEFNDSPSIPPNHHNEDTTMTDQASSEEDTVSITCCGSAIYTYTSSDASGTWIGTHSNHNPYHHLEIMAIARRIATQLLYVPASPPLSAASPNPERRQSEASDNSSETLDNSSEASEIPGRPQFITQMIFESDHSDDEVIRAAMFTIQYELNQTPEGAYLMVTHQRPGDVNYALEALDTAPELRYLADIRATEAIVWDFINGEDVSHLL